MQLTEYQTHITVTAVTAAVILYTRDAHAVWFASGALLSSFAGESSLFNYPTALSLTSSSSTKY